MRHLCCVAVESLDGVSDDEKRGFYMAMGTSKEVVDRAYDSTRMCRSVAAVTHRLVQVLSAEAMKAKGYKAAEAGPGPGRGWGLVGDSGLGRR